MPLHAPVSPFLLTWMFCVLICCRLWIRKWFMWFIKSHATMIISRRLMFREQFVWLTARKPQTAGVRITSWKIAIENRVHWLCKAAFSLSNRTISESILNLILWSVILFVSYDSAVEQWTTFRLFHLFRSCASLLIWLQFFWTIDISLSKFLLQDIVVDSIPGDCVWISS